MYNLVARRNVAVGQLRAKGANTKNPYHIVALLLAR